MRDDALERGMALRREVMGDEYVDQMVAKRTEWTEEYQDLVTRYAFSEIWSRPGLDRRIRSSITIAMLIALNRMDELRVHVAVAERNGISRAELRELFMHASIYCGMPAARAAFMVAEEVLG
jgi:4-carboxymuconolactone decarboxylase